MADGAGGHTEFDKMLKSVHWMKLFAPNLIQRCNTTTLKCPTELEVNSRDVISQTYVWNKMDLSQRLTTEPNFTEFNDANVPNYNGCVFLAI